MGVRVTSQGPGKNVMMCAHRYRQWMPGQYVPHLLTGQCYLLGDDLRAGGDERTWRREVCDSQHLLTRRMDHEWFAYCQQGHGATFAKDNTSVIFGAPGAYQWKGIVRMEPLDNVDIDSEDPRETGDINQFNPRLIPLHRSSYLGFSLDTGLSLLRKGELTIVSGAPRGGYSGQVAFLKPDPDASRNLSVEFILSGPGLASSFGYDLAVVDLNGDGWEDLVVGAPQFFVKDGEVGGAVYIYVNNKGTNWVHVEPIQLLGHADSMFGLAVENIGDINQDDFGDIAVGAPYEESGRVYIYCGSPRGINKKPAQVISPGSNTVTLFGYSLSGNLDVDNNHYPDLAVGALSGTVFVYRAKPVVSVAISLKVTPNVIDITKEQCQTQTCYFAARACYRYTANSGAFNLKLLLNYTFEADSEKRKARLSTRMDFLDPNKGQLELPAQNVEKCIDKRLRLVREITDKLHKIPISVAISLVSSSPSLQTSQSDLSPVLNLYQQKKAISEITLINTGCGPDNICQSQLAAEYKFCSIQKENSKNVFKSLHRDNGLAVITPSDRDIALEISVTNRNGDDAHQSGLSITLPDTLYYTTVYHTQVKSPVSCTANEKGTLIDCELGNPLQRNGEVTFYVILATSGISLSTKHVNVTLLLKTLTRPSQVSMGESSKGESAINSIQEIGTPVQYEFRITNLGRPLKSFANISLNIFWPKENSVGKWLLYLTHISSKGVQPNLCSPATEINPLKQIKGWSDIKRRKRQVEGELEPLSTEDIIFLPFKRTHKTLTCSDGLSCVEIRCPLQGLDSNALIVLHSHLWNTTFTEDYSSLNYLEIVVDASLSLTQSPENIGLISDGSLAKVKLTVFLEKKVEYLTKVAWWIILLTVIALLLLLVFTIFVMWKYGPASCFSSNKKTNNEEERQETVPLKL
ncbi:integrin alpha-6-like [Boleophthalmus pectinirostris]|uniref:integrin alpha-6-like n=1 Tax=Boleophthalmus pectinirostris TaxID=150288 RepID=UPI00242F117F|nr:integrin alpha-6-like [Boleophthalmus pectinirostris]